MKFIFLLKINSL